MKWFSGSIADAVTASKSTNAVFVVYVEGQDELSKTMSSAVDSSVVSRELSSNKFVCIKLDKDSESHKQFTEIYKIVPVPSLFFIGENGVPLEIIAGDNNSDAVNKKIVSAISKIKGEPLNLEEAPVASRSRETTPVPDVPKSADSSVKVSPSSSSTNVTKETNDASKQAEIERAQELIKMKREENKKLDEEKEKERELNRRRMGKEIAQARKSQQEKEMEQMRKDREKEKKLEAEARQRVLRQIEEDKANRAARMAANNGQPVTSSSNSNVNTNHPEQRQSSPRQADEGRIQFKLPDGQTRSQTFPASATLRELRTFIDNNVTVPFNEYTLATTFPRREYTSRDLNSTISELQLLPSSVILILPVKGDTTVMRGPGWTAALSALFWGLVQPVFDFGYYIRSLITGTPRPDASSSTNATPNPPSNTRDQQQPRRSPYYQQNVGGQKNVRRRGNVHTLNDGNDSNDENNTWNGNSTQLM